MARGCQAALLLAWALAAALAGEPPAVHASGGPRQPAPRGAPAGGLRGTASPPSAPTTAAVPMAASAASVHGGDAGVAGTYGRAVGAAATAAAEGLGSAAWASPAQVTAVAANTSSGVGEQPANRSTVPCLCIFDVDRTLTGKQGLPDDTCPGSERHPDVTDYAYGGGVLTLSQVSARFQATFCAQCYLGIVSHGSASGLEMKAKLLSHFQGSGQLLGQYDWSYDCNVRSPLVLECAEGQKQGAVRRILGWYESNGVPITDDEVYFFDDRRHNVEPFIGTGFNARQVSCRSRVGWESVGLCGAETAEIVPEKGVSICAP